MIDAQSLPFAAFEHYMLADSSPDIEMGDCYRFTFAGVLEEGPFRQGLVVAAQRHPLFTATFAGQLSYTTARLRWRLGARQPYVSWGQDSTSIEIPPNARRMIDLSKEAGLRVFVRVNTEEDHESTMVLLQVHHAVADASGVLRFMEDVLSYYGHLVERTPLVLPDVNQDIISRRGQLKSALRPGIKAKFLYWYRIYKFFSTIPEPLFTEQGVGTRPIDIGEKGHCTGVEWPPAVTVSLPHDVWQKARLEAKKQGATFNDYLLCALMRTLDKWNSQIAHAKSRRKFRIAMAVNMRQHEHATMPAANVVSMCYVDANARRLDLPGPQLLKSFAAETRSIKANGLGYAMVRLLELCGRIPCLVPLAVRPRWPFKCMVTSVLSNLGHPFQGSHLQGPDGRVVVGDAILERVEAMPAGRAYLAAGFTVNSYGGQLSLTLSYDAKRLRKDDADKLVKLYIHQIEQGL